jgi:hypothetical protein
VDAYEKALRDRLAEVKNDILIYTERLDLILLGQFEPAKILGKECCSDYVKYFLSIKEAECKILTNVLVRAEEIKKESKA